MHWLWEHIMQAGWIAWPILLVGFAGVGVTVVLVVMVATRSKYLRAAGLLTLGVAALCIDLWIEEALKQPAPERQESLLALKSEQRRLRPNDAQLKRIHAELAP